MCSGAESLRWAPISVGLLALIYGLPAYFPAPAAHGLSENGVQGS